MMLIGSKSGKKKQIWANFGRCTGTCTGVYRYTPPEAKVYRYMFRVYRYTLFCFPNFDQFLYFSHHLLISYPIYVIQVATETKLQVEPNLKK